MTSPSTILTSLFHQAKTVALVGESGSGKSTLANLLLRFYDTTTGELTIDGHPIRDIELNSLRQNIALVNQQAILFSDTVSANIAYGEDLKDKKTRRDINSCAACLCRSLHFKPR